MAKINDKLFCSGGKKGFIYIVSVDPVQVIQKIYLGEIDYDYSKEYIRFLHNSNNEFIFTSFDGIKIIQFKIINDEENNFIELEQFDIIDNGQNNNAIITTIKEKIFYKKKFENSYVNPFLFKNYKINTKGFKISLDKYLNF